MEDGDRYDVRALVVTTGTFLNGLIHVGLEQRPAGRHGEPPSRELAESIKSFGFEMGRLKTGTPPRLDRDSIDFDGGGGDAASSSRSAATPRRSPFSFATSAPLTNQVSCWLLHTTDRVRDLVRGAHRREPALQRPDSGNRPALLPIARGQDHAVSRPGAASDLPRARGRGRRRDLRERVLDVAAARRAGAARSRAARPRGRRRCCGRATRWNTTSSSRRS